jgi:hypothetical protein
MRKILPVITAIQALLPDPPPPEIADQIIVLKATLRLQARGGLYAAPEGDDGSWEALTAALYRYMPQLGSYPWVQQVSDIVTGVTPV